MGVYLIDCYNLLHTPMPQPLAGLDEAGLVGRMTAAGMRGRVVCDGTEKPHAPAGLSTDVVELVYAGPGRSADAMISTMVQADSAPRKVVVVSNDRTVQKGAKARRARVMSCEAFIGELARRSGRKGRTQPGDVKPMTTDPDYWLREFGLDGEPGNRR